MRYLNQFSMHEWLHLDPLVHGLKQLRNDALLRHYLRQRTPSLQPFLQQHAGLAARPLGIVIAFEQPWALDWLLVAAAVHLPGTPIAVFDNSREPASRADIAAVCARHGAPYLALPSYRTRHVNRSHGMAMSWVFHNVVRPLQPSIFGFFDHDLIPVRPMDLAERLGTQPVYGMLNAGNLQHWSLWAGYCVYRMAAVESRPLNFLYDFSRGLDTGGRNWKPLYQGLDRGQLRFAEQRFDRMRLPSGETREVELVDDRWLHIGGISYNNNLAPKFAFYSSLRRALETGTPLQTLLASARTELPVDPKRTKSLC